MRRFAAVAALALAACAKPAPRPFLAIETPAGERPFPAVLIAPACGDPAAAHGDAMAAWLRADGFATGLLSLDPTACADAPSAAAALGRAVATAKADARIDGARVQLAAWGEAASGLLVALAADLETPSAVATYPDCPPRAAWRSRTPTLLNLAAAAPGAASCEAWADATQGPAPLTIARYAGARSGFDIPANPAYAPDSAALLWREIRAYLLARR